ncbi:MAG: HAMP domain-containing histidine kinase [Bacteroidales bacterium]|nr:HAMP domain-containing histidine kinase [Bacteroidales bacterium]
MSRRLIRIVCILLPLAFIGLTIMQVRWIANAVEQKREMYSQIVFRSMDNVISRLEKDELTDNQPRRPFTAKDFTVSSQSQEKRDFDAKSRDVTLTFTMDEYGFYRIDTRTGEKALSTDVGRVETGGNLGTNLSEAAKSAIVDILVRQARLRQAKESKSFFENRPIERRVNSQRLDALLMQQFDDNGIRETYEFAVFNAAGSVAYHTPGYAPTEKTQIYEKRLYPNDMHSKAHYVRVYFNDKPNALDGLWIYVLPTVGFLVVVFCLSIYSLYIIFRQKKLDEIKNDFIGNMTHEFKTPIATISLAAQLTNEMSDFIKPDSIRRNSKIIIDESKRLTGQVERILQLASFESGRSQLRKVERDINEIVEKVVETFRIQVDNAGGEINLRLEAEDSIAMVDEVHFTNVVHNLLENALKYRRDAPMLSIVTRNANNGIIVSIKDNGLGISKENQKMIFDKFYRVSTGDRHDIKGFGLGLAYVKKIVEEHGGRISVESELNVGTKFDIYLPIKIN